MTVNHDNADPFNSAKDLMAMMVEVTGVVSERGGARIIDVIDVKATPAPASK